MPELGNGPSEIEVPPAWALLLPGNVSHLGTKPCLARCSSFQQALPSRKRILPSNRVALIMQYPALNGPYQEAT